MLPWNSSTPPSLPSLPACLPAPPPACLSHCLRPSRFSEVSLARPGEAKQGGSCGGSRARSPEPYAVVGAEVGVAVVVVKEEVAE